MASLDMVSELLYMIRGLAPVEQPTPASVSMISGTAVLARHSAAILSLVPDEHRTRIMVTMPSEAADDPVLIRGLLARGMQIMRINCAHDNLEVWAGMVLHLRRAEKRLSRTCTVCFDVAGPKLRSGPIGPRMGVVKWRPRRDPLGRVTEPAVVHLTTATMEQAPERWSIPGPDALTAKARIGDAVELVDARGKRRRLKIVQVSRRMHVPFRYNRVFDRWHRTGAAPWQAGGGENDGGRVAATSANDTSPATGLKSPTMIV